MADPIVPPQTPEQAAAPAAGKVVMRSGDGRLYEVAPEDVALQQRDQGWSVAGDAEVQARVAERVQYSQFGSTGQQALGQGERFLRTATLGAVQGAGDAEAIAGRQALTREESPVTSFLTQAAGAAVPALAGGALAGGAAAGLGLGARGAGLATTLVEGAASGTAEEVEEAQAQHRSVSAGNILMYGVGGEILGRAVPSVLRKGASAFRNRLAGEAVDEAGEHVLAGAERKALESAADVADGVPLGPDRDTFLVNAEKQIIDTGSQRAAQSLDTINQTMGEITGSGAKRNKIRSLVAETHPAQRQWAADTSQGALDLRAELKPRAAPPVDPTLPPGATAPLPIDYAKVPGLAKPARELTRILTEGSQRIDDASGGADWFEASGDLERSLHAQESAIRKAVAKADPLDQAAGQELLGKVSAYRSQLRVDRERPDLWGDAGDLQKGLNTALEDHWRPGSDAVDGTFGTQAGESVRFDPSKLRGHLSADEVGRGVTPEFLEKKLAGAEQAIATHRKFGTASDAQLSRMQKAVESVREQLRLSDDVRGAKARTAERAGVARESARFEREQARPERSTLDLLGETAAEFLPFGGPLYRLGKKVLRGGELSGADAAEGIAEAVAPGPTRAYQRARELIDRRRASAAAEGAVYVDGRLKSDPSTELLKEKMLGSDAGKSVFGALSEGDLEKVFGVGRLTHDSIPNVQELNFNPRTGHAEVKVSFPGDNGGVDLERTFDYSPRLPEGDFNRFYVTHDRFFLPDVDKGKKLATKYFSEMAPIYKKMGITRVIIPELVDDGAVVWARMGFRPVGSGVERRILDEAAGAGIRATSLRELAAIPEGAALMRKLADSGSTARWFRHWQSTPDELMRLYPASAAGHTEFGSGIGDILTSPIGLVSAAGVAALGGAKAYQMAAQSEGGVDTKRQRLSRLIDTLGRTGAAMIGSAAKGAVHGSTVPAMRAVDSAQPAQSTAIARFQGDYPTVQSSFAAKARTLQAIVQDPLALHRAAAQSLGGIDEVNPQLHGEVAARLAEVANYLYENLPAQLSASMTRPNGIPLSRTTARDFALKYNSVTNPASVLADVRDGTASPTQLKALEAVHPDIYQSLRLELARQVSEEPQMTTQRKLRLDILFGGDGMAGRAFGWGLANAIQARRQRISTGAVGSGKSHADVSKQAPQSRGLSTIGGSVTNSA